MKAVIEQALQKCAAKSRIFDKITLAPYTEGSDVWRWSTGNVICQPQSTASMYCFREQDGVEYLLIQWKSGDYTFGGEEPYWYVFYRDCPQ